MYKTCWNFICCCFLFLLVSTVTTEVKARHFSFKDGQIDSAATSAANFAPFSYGIASGEPSFDSIHIATRLALGKNTISMNEVLVNWEISLDSNFVGVVHSGAVIAYAKHDWKVVVAVKNLNAGLRYFYRFKDVTGRTSAVGKIQTLTKGSDEAEKQKILQHQIAVYPNPLQNNFFVDLTLQKEQIVQITIHDSATGKLVQHLFAEQLFKGTRHKLLFTSNFLDAGLYLLKIKGEDFDRAYRLVK